MPPFREVIKRALPSTARNAFIRVREWAAPPPLEEIALHAYAFTADPSPGRRLTLVIPHIAAERAFGGIMTGLDLLFGIARRSGASVRIVLDDFGPATDRSLAAAAARMAGMNPTDVSIEARTDWVPRLTVRAGDVFMGFHTWITLNLVPVLAAQAKAFGGTQRPLLYPIQEYEPLFYPMSSTHLLARAAFDLPWPCWGIFNSRELHDFFMGQGHEVARAFVFEPQLAPALRPYLDGEPPGKTRQILVYGRPSIPRNCFPAVVAGLRRWAGDHPSQAGWQVVSAGLQHRPVPIGPGRAMRSLGKLTLAEYAGVLRESAVGIALMASPHPSYPPLEMAHFGLRTITNRYGHAKDLAATHPNILSVADILPATLARALSSACAAFEAAPGDGWGLPSGRPSFLDPAPFACLDEIADALSSSVWRE